MGHMFVMVLALPVSVEPNLRPLTHSAIATLCSSVRLACVGVGSHAAGRHRLIELLRCQLLEHLRRHRFLDVLLAMTRFAGAFAKNRGARSLGGSVRERPRLRGRRSRLLCARKYNHKDGQRHGWKKPRPAQLLQAPSLVPSPSSESRPKRVSCAHAFYARFFAR